MSEHRLKRLLYRASHRGTKEMDLILGGFAEAEADTLSEADVEAFEQLLNESDPDLYSWIVSGSAVPDGVDGGMIDRIRRHSTQRATT